MSFTEDERQAIVSYRIKKANDTLEEAKGIASLGYWNAVTNRLYYACYYITGALLIRQNLSAHTHQGVIHLLGLHFISKGTVSKEAGRLYSRLFDLRQTGDYDDLFFLNEEDVKPLIARAEKYVEEILGLIINKK
jgi:uncharacterized protein (UPF0332 family)